MKNKGEDRQNQIMNIHWCESFKCHSSHTD